MSLKSILKPSDYEDFLVHIYFESRPNLAGCIRVSYLDLCRTLREVSKSGKNIRNQEAIPYLEQVFSELKNQGTQDQEQFDTWHKDVCNRLVEIYKENSYTKFHIGQAQKWVNMTFKYIFTLGEQRVPGFSEVYEFCHAPLDSKIVEKLEKEYGFPPLKCGRWSHLDYGEYFCIQQRIRRRFRLAPLDVEFLLWSGKDIDKAYIILGGEE